MKDNPLHVSRQSINTTICMHWTARQPNAAAQSSKQGYPKYMQYTRMAVHGSTVTVHVLDDVG
jgi:hypothetical protein